MVRASNIATKGQEVKKLEKEILELSEKLGDLIVNYRAVLGGTGIPMPKPPRPMIEVVGRLTYFAFLLSESFRPSRRSPM